MRVWSTLLLTFATLWSPLLLATEQCLRPDINQAELGEDELDPIDLELYDELIQHLDQPRNLLQQAGLFSDSQFEGVFPFLTRAEAIPQVNHLDSYYTTPGQAPYCLKDWRNLRRQSIQKQPITIPYSFILAMARRAAIPFEHLDRTLNVFLSNQLQIPNQRYVTMIDFNKHASRRRMFILDLRTGEIEGYMMAHGSGSDPDKSGFAKRFSNVDSSAASSLGCALVGGEISGKYGRRTLLLHGFEKTNDNMCDREVVVHPANYIGSGRSEGCPALSPKDIAEVYSKISNGGLICAYYDGDELNWEDRVPVIKKHKKFKSYKANKHKKKKNYKKIKLKRSKKRN